MSRAYDARQHAIVAYPEDREAAVSLFLNFLDISEEDFSYEFNQTAEEYIFAKTG